MMLIKTQNSHQIVNLDNVETIQLEGEGFRMITASSSPEKTIFLGNYSTTKKAEKVLTRIINFANDEFYSKHYPELHNGIQPHGTIFIMPTDDEV